jgi:hypothetical protein
MSYGIEFKNDYGDNVLKSKGLLFEHSTGNAIRAERINPLINNRFTHTMSLVQFSDLNTGAGANNTAVNSQLSTVLSVSNLTDGGSFDISRNHKPLIHHQSNSYVVRNYPNVSGLSRQGSARLHYAISNTSDTSYHYEAFFKLIPSGLHNWTQEYNPYNNAFDSNNKGLHIQVLPSSKHNHADVPYIVAWNKVPSVAAESYGMQSNDANGDVIFDSRFNAKAIRVKDYVTVTAAQFEDCLENDTTYNFTLRQAITNPYVGGDPQMNTRNDVVNNNGFYWYRPTFKLTTSTNLQMYRTVYKWNNNAGWGNPPEFQRYQDCLITLLDA